MNKNVVFLMNFRNSSYDLFVSYFTNICELKYLIVLSSLIFKLSLVSKICRYLKNGITRNLTHSYHTTEN